MPYAPTERNQVGEYAFRGITGAGNVLSEAMVKAIEKIDQTKKEDAFGDFVMDHYSKVKGPDGQPYVPIEALAKYHAAASSARAGMVHAVLANATFDLQNGQLARQNRLADAQTNLNEAKAFASWTGQDSGGSNDPTQIDPYTDPGTRQTVPGMGVVRKTGQVVRTSGPELEDPDKFGRFWNGKQYVQMRKDKVDPMTALATIDRQNEIDGVTKQIAEHENQLAKGSKYDGEWLGMGGTKRTTIIEGLKEKRRALVEGGMGTAPAAPATASTPQPVATPGAAPQQIRVKAPDGRIGMIPASQLPGALAAGYQQL